MHSRFQAPISAAVDRASTTARSSLGLGAPGNGEREHISLLRHPCDCDVGAYAPQSRIVDEHAQAPARPLLDCAAAGREVVSDGPCSGNRCENGDLVEPPTMIPRAPGVIARCADPAIFRLLPARPACSTPSEAAFAESWAATRFCCR